MWVWIINICTVLSSFSEVKHPVHIAVTTIEIVEEKNEIQLFFKLNIHDLKLALYHNYQIELVFHDSISNLNNEYIDIYLNDKFSIQTKRKKKIDLIGVEFEGENCLIKYSAKLKNKDLSKINISNLIFTDLYYDQKNLVIFKYNDFEKGYELGYNDTNITLNLKE